MKKKQKPLIYSCSGCSSSAQMANWIALEMDKMGAVEMSCISGVGGGVRPLVHKAQQAETLIGLDGCALNCVQHCLEREKLECSAHYNLAEFGVAKELQTDFDRSHARSVLRQIYENLESRNLLKTNK